MTYAVLSHVGIEEGATLGMEVKEPKRQIPLGLWVAAVVVPAFYIFVAYAMVYGYGIDKMAEFGEDPAPLQTIANSYWGEVGLTIVVLATLSSILAFSQTAFLAGARVLYTLGREGVLPHRLGTVSARQTPGVGIAVMAVLSMALGVPLAFLVGPFNVWGYFGFLISIAFLVSYIFTNFGLIRYMRRIGEFKWFRHGVLGLLGSIVFLYPLYKTVWPLQTGIYGALPFVFLAWIAVGVGLLFFTLRKRPEVIGTQSAHRLPKATIRYPNTARFLSCDNNTHRRRQTEGASARHRSARRAGAAQRDHRRRRRRGRSDHVDRRRRSTCRRRGPGPHRRHRDPAARPRRRRASRARRAGTRSTATAR